MRAYGGSTGASHFEELVVWQKAKSLSIAVYRAAATGRVARDYGLRDQMQRASVSVMSNVAEGFERRSRREFARFLSIAQGSLGELQSQIHLSRELEYVDAQAVDQLLGRCNELRRMIIALRKAQSP